MNMARKLKTIKTMQQRKNRAFDIFYDTIWSITKWVPSHIKRHKFLVKVDPFSGAKVSCMVDYVKLTISDDKPDHVILHTGTNALRSSKKTVSQIARSITELPMSLKTMIIQFQSLVSSRDVTTSAIKQMKLIIAWQEYLKNETSHFFLTVNVLT